MQDLAIPGLSVIPIFLSLDEQSELIKTIDALEWSEGSVQKRRIQHYGVTYDYETHAPNFDKVINIPSVFDLILQKIDNLHLSGSKANQLIINEYIHHQGIGKHIDPVSFGEFVFSLSLGSPVPMVFSKGEQKHTVLLEPGSLLIMSGESRYEWHHEIPYSKLVRWNDESTGEIVKFKREKSFRRVSLTVRCVPQ